MPQPMAGPERNKTLRRAKSGGFLRDSGARHVGDPGFGKGGTGLALERAVAGTAGYVGLPRLATAGGAQASHANSGLRAGRAVLRRR